MNNTSIYKDTNLDWIPSIPEYWDVIRSKFIFENKSVKNCPDEPLLSVTQKNGLVLRSDLETKVWNPTDDTSGYKLVESGDFVISLRSFEGGLELSRIRGLVSPAYTVLKSTKTIDLDYYRWLMKSQEFIVELNKNVTGIRQGKNIGWDDFGNIYLCSPPLEEQQLISRYLDKKTEQIDSLIEKIQKKIELLKEQRTSLINQCVTKGLDPDVETKDSGVEWIGEIPSHWNLRKLTRFCDRVRNGYVGPTRDIMFETGITYLQGIHTDKTGTITFTPNGPFYVSPDWSEKHKETILRTDDIVVVQTGTIGNLGYVTEEFDGSNCHAMIIVSTDKTICYGRYLMYSFLSSYVQNFLQSIKTGEILHHINTKKLRLLNVLLPPLDQQREIVGHLDRETYLIDRLLEKEGQRIGLLKEYRQSLISSVVTGKVRVTEDMI